MTASSTKNLYRSLLLAAVCLSRPAAAGWGFSTSYKITAESRLAFHASEPRDLASHRHILDAEQTLTFDSNWLAVLGLRAYAEGAFAKNESAFGPQVRRDESADLRLRDFYLQLKTRSLLLKVGNQQVVWGEAFGFYYADLINPKDLRDFGLRDLTAQRLMMPMLNAVLFFKNASLQFLFAPKPFFNLVPAVDGDFSPWASLIPNTPLKLVDSTQGNFSIGDGEVGLRLTTLLRGYDIGFFFFTYFDRSPVYTGTPTPTGLDLVATHNRVGSFGLTFTKDAGPWLLRWESLFTKNKAFQKFASGALTHYEGDEVTVAAEAEYTAWLPWRVALQLAYQGIPRFDADSTTPRHRELVSANVKAPLWGEQTLDAIVSWAVHDGGSLTRLQYTIPTSQQFELMLGADLLLGGSRSQFGAFQSGSRFYVQLKGYLAK
jgi:hypothetical protein